MTALAAIAHGEATPVTAGVHAWLLPSGFVKAAAATADSAITPRARLWLASFDEDLAAALAAPSAADFARHRA
jgi:hypothetical protein